MIRLVFALSTSLAVVQSADAGWRSRRAAVHTTRCQWDTAPAATTASESFDPSGFLAEVNRVRAAHGLASLGWSDQRAEHSRRHADIVARSRGAFHPGRYSIGRGEIMARGQRSIGEAIGDWLRSPGHRALLLGDFRSCGVARSGDVWFAQFE